MFYSLFYDFLTIKQTIPRNINFSDIFKCNFKGWNASMPSDNILLLY